MHGFFLNLASRGPDERNILSILIYHRVIEARDPLRPATIDASDFDKHMSWVSSTFNVLSLHIAVEKLKKGRLPPKALAITFDDGYIDNLSIATPILQKYNLTATFFIPTSYLEGKGMWRDYLIESVRQTKKPRIELAGKQYTLNSIEDKALFCEEAGALIKPTINSNSSLQLEDLVEELGKAEFPDLMMKVKDLQFLSRSGMEVGSHTQEHLNLTQISDDKARIEINSSKQELENILQDRVAGFAYPNGIYDERHVGFVEAARYQYAVTTRYGYPSQPEHCYKLGRYTPWRRYKSGFMAEIFMCCLRSRKPQ